jgi:hypothetical protein
MHRSLPIALALASLALAGCGGHNGYWNPAADAAQEKTYTLTWYTGTKDNGNGTANGYVTVSPGGDSHDFPNTFKIPAGATVTITAHPDPGATVNWALPFPGTDPLVRTFTLNGDASAGCSFSTGGNG